MFGLHKFSLCLGFYFLSFGRECLKMRTSSVQGTWWNPAKANQRKEMYLFQKVLVMVVCIWRSGKSLHGTEVWNPILFPTLLFRELHILCSVAVRLKNKLIQPVRVREVFSWAWNKYRPDLFLGNKSNYCEWNSWIPTQGYSSDRPGHPMDPLCPNMGNGLWVSLD